MNTNYFMTRKEKKKKQKTGKLTMEKGCERK